MISILPSNIVQDNYFDIFKDDVKIGRIFLIRYDGVVDKRFRAWLWLFRLNTQDIVFEGSLDEGEQWWEQTKINPDNLLMEMLL